MLKTIETSATPHVTVTECLGDLVVRGAEVSEISLRLRNGGDELDLAQVGESFTIVSRADCLLTCPRGTTVTIHAVRGDLKVKEIGAPLAIGDVYGDVSLRAVGPISLEQAYGDLSARQVMGDMQVDSVAGDARVYGVDGQLTLKKVGGTLRTEGLQNGLEAESVGSDVRLGPPFSPGATYRVVAGSDLRVNLPIDASVRLALRAGGGVRSRLPDLVLEEIDGETFGTLGEAEATLEAEVGSYISLRPGETERLPRDELDFQFVADLEGMGLAIETHVADAMAEMEARLEESLSRIDSEAIRLRIERATEKSRHAAERAVAQAHHVAEREAERARRTAEREAERARLRQERAERRWQRVSGKRTEPRPPVASDEERLRVLHMLESGTITTEQAAELLSALEGR